MTQQAIQPILILKEGTLRARGKNAQSANIFAVRAVAEAVRTTLSPKGMILRIDDVVAAGKVEKEKPPSKEKEDFDSEY